MTRKAESPGRRRWRHAGGAAALALGIAMATYPAWRVALLGSEPTLEELRRFTCSATGPAGPPAWLVQRGAVGGVAAPAVAMPVARPVRSQQD